MARICVNALSVNPAMTGIGQYARSLLHALAHAPVGVKAGHEFVVLGSAGHDLLGNGGNGESRRSKDKGTPGLPRTWRLEIVKGATPLWEQVGLPTMIEQDEVDIFHSPLFTAPIVKVCGYVVTIHDVIPLTHPALVPDGFRRLFEQSVGPALRAADVVVTTSESAKAEIAAHLMPSHPDLKPERVRVARQCVSGEFRPRGREEITAVIRRHGLEPGKYLLYVGAIDPRKNVEGLIAAYVRGRIFEDFGLRLAMCGRSADGRYTLDTAIERAGMAKAGAGGAGAAEGVLGLGYIPNDDLPQVMAGAKAFVFPSFAEGFGRPVLEAMATGVPVVASDIPSLRELAADAAEFVDPANVDDMAAVIRHVLSEGEAEAGARRERGLARAAEFTPERFAADILGVYQELETATGADSD